MLYISKRIVLSPKARVFFIGSIITIGLLQGSAAAQNLERNSQSVEAQQSVKMNQFKLGSVSVSGNKQFSRETILDYIPSLKIGQILDVQKISDEVMFANTNAALKMTVDIVPQSSTDADVVIRVEEGKTVRSMLTFDNTGDGQTGKSRVGIITMDYNWLARGQTAVFSYTKAPSNSQVNQFGFVDSIPLPKTGDTLSISGSYSDVDSGVVANYFNISGKGKTFGVHYNQQLKHTNDSGQSIDYGIDYKEYDNVIDFSGSNLGTHIKTLPVSISYQYSKLGHGYSVSNTVGITENMSTGSSSQEVFDASRVGSEVNYTILRQNASYQKQLHKGWLFNAQMESQYASKPLISGEQFGLGGSHSVRGYNEREAAGDKGFRLTTEFYTPEIAKGQKLLVFFDQGKYWRNSPQAGEIPDGSLASYGVGWRLNTAGGTSIAVDWAKALKATDNTPDHSTRVHISASQSF